MGKRLLEVIAGIVTLQNSESGLCTSIQIPIGQPKKKNQRSTNTRSNATE